MATVENLGLAKRSVRSNSSLNLFSAFDGNILGGSLLGVGMSLSGACPGTVLVQLADRVPSSGYVAAGGVLGGIVHARYGKRLRRGLLNKEEEEACIRPTIGSRFGLPKGLDLVLFVAGAAAIVVFSARNLPGKAETMIPTTAGGLLIGFAQAVSLLATSSALGSSALYEQIGQYFWHSVGVKDVPKPSALPRSFFFAAGVVLGSIGLTNFFSLPTPAVAETMISKTQGVVGGFLVVLGARIAGGCTSGHGISGLAAMSYASLITAASIFAGGIAFQFLM